MRFGIVVFPGSNCDRDAHHVVTQVLGEPAALVPHTETDLSGYDAIILPSAPGERLIAGHAAGVVPPPYTGGLGQEGVAQLKAFVEDALVSRS